MKTPSAWPRTAWLVQILALAIAYAITGRLGLLLALPPGYATPVWPASGIALACLLLFGNRLWPGVWLGSFLVNCWVLFDANGTVPLDPDALPAAAIGLGAAVQAAIGTGLVRRYAGTPSALDRPQNIITLLLLGGPVACVVGATWAVGVLVLSASISTNDGLVTWLTWWAGDVLGVLAVTPVVLTLFGEPRDLWRRRRLSVAVPLIATYAVVTAVCAYAKTNEKDRLDNALGVQADTMANALEQRMIRYNEALDSIRRFYASSKDVDRDEFRTFTQGVLGSHPGIQALEWIPRVPDAQRTALEQRAQQEGHAGFQILELDADGQLTPAGKRHEYFPVLYACPLEGNEAAVGFDLASNPTRLAALHQARDTGRMTATAPIALIQDRGSQSAYLLFCPIYQNGLPHETLEDRRKNLHGFALGVLRIGDIVRASLNDLIGKGTALHVYDGSAGPDRKQVYVFQTPQASPTTSADAPPRVEQVQCTRTIPIANRHWTLVFSLTPDDLISKRQWQTWIAIVPAAVLLTGLLGTLLLTVTGRTAEIEQTVTTQTQQLSQANDRMKAIFDAASGVSIIATDPSGVITVFNRGAENMLGYTLDEVVGRHTPSLVHLESELTARSQELTDELGEPVAGLDVLMELPKRDGTEQRHWTYVRKDGSQLTVNLRITAVRGDSGQITGFLAIAVDVTQQKRSETALRASQERFDRAVRGTSAGLWDWDLRNNQVWYAPRFKELLGYANDEFPSTFDAFESHLHPEDRQNAMHAIREHLATGQTYDVNYRLRTKNGRYCWFRARGMAVRDETGQPVRMAGSIEDITKRKQAEDMSHQVIEFAPNAMVMINPDGRIVLVNKQTEELFGYRRQELLGQLIEILVPPRFREKHPKQRTAFFADPTIRAMGAGRDLYGYRKDGSEFPVEIGLNPIQTNDGVMVLSAIVDITERKQAEEEFKAFTAKIQQSNRELEEFARVASHDLQEPLRKVQAFSDRLKSRYAQELPDNARQYIDRMQNATGRMQQLINDLLSYSRVTTNNQPFVPVDLSRVAAEVVSDLEIRIQENNGRVDLDDLPTIDADPTQIRQLFQNLIGNGLKYRQPDLAPVVRIIAELVEDSRSCRISFSDNGIGFDSKYTDRIFTVFQRLHTRGTYEGTGVGLAICRKIVERHGGTITADSTVGQGSTFTVTLPVAQGPGRFESMAA